MIHYLSCPPAAGYNHCQDYDDVVVDTAEMRREVHV